MLTSQFGLALGLVLLLCLVGCGKSTTSKTFSNVDLSSPASTWTSLTDSEKEAAIAALIREHPKPFHGLTISRMSSIANQGPDIDHGKLVLEKWLIGKACTMSTALSGGDSDDGPYCGVSGFGKVQVTAADFDTAAKQAKAEANAEANAPSAKQGYAYATVLEADPSEWRNYPVAVRESIVRRYLKKNPRFTAISAAALHKKANEYDTSSGTFSVDEMLFDISDRKQRVANKLKKLDQQAAQYRKLIRDEGAIGMTIEQLVDQLGRYDHFQRIGKERLYYYGNSQVVVEGDVITQINIY